MIGKVMAWIVVIAVPVVLFTFVGVNTLCRVFTPMAKLKTDIDGKRRREKETVYLMIGLYCRKKHGGKSLCPECAALYAYAEQRIDHCQFMETKTFCSSCKVHCYKPDMREQIRRVMRFSGPRMIFYHPIMAIRHIIETKKEKQKR